MAKTIPNRPKPPQIAPNHSKTTPNHPKTIPNHLKPPINHHKPIEIGHGFRLHPLLSTTCAKPAALTSRPGATSTLIATTSFPLIITVNTDKPVFVKRYDFSL